MGRISNSIKTVISIMKHDGVMTDKIRFQIFACFMIAEHFILACAGLCLGCYSMVASQAVAVVVEAWIAIHVVQRYYSYFFGISVIYFVTCAEPMIAAVLVGWNFGFGVYNMLMIVVLFYMLYMTKAAPCNRLVLSIYVLVNCVGTLLVRFLVYRYGALYEFPMNAVFAFSFLNFIIGYLLVVTFSGLFLLELIFRHQVIKSQTEELQFFANRDELTKLRNRRSMLDIWGNLDRRDYCVVMGDIDDFKKCNDTYGHEVGDEVLKLVARSMSEAVDEVDYVSRWGGEEFLMIVFGNLGYALKVIDKVQRELKEEIIEADGQQIAVTLTFGIAECSEVPDGDMDGLIRCADRRLYKGKERGKNCIVIKDE